MAISVAAQTLVAAFFLLVTSISAVLMPPANIGQWHSTASSIRHTINTHKRP